MQSDIDSMAAGRRHWGFMIEKMKADLPKEKQKYLELDERVRHLESRLSEVREELYGQ